MDIIGKPLERKEDARLLTGNGRFSDDFGMAGQAHAAMVRSPYPHAVIKKVSVEKAKTAPGVIGVFTGSDCAADGLQPIPHSALPSTRYDMKLTGPRGGAIPFDANVLLPCDKARHAGEAIAMVVAETREQAADAAEMVEVEYGELPWVTHSEDAFEGGAP